MGLLIFYFYFFIDLVPFFYTPMEWKETLKEENYFIKEINQKGQIIYAKK